MFDEEVGKSVSVMSCCVFGLIVKVPEEKFVQAIFDVLVLELAFADPHARAQFFF